MSMTNRHALIGARNCLKVRTFRTFRMLIFSHFPRRLSRLVTYHHLRKMSQAKSIAVLDESELNDGEMCVS